MFPQGWYLIKSVQGVSFSLWHLIWDFGHKKYINDTQKTETAHFAESSEGLPAYQTARFHNTEDPCMDFTSL